MKKKVTIGMLLFSMLLTSCGTMSANSDKNKEQTVITPKATDYMENKEETSDEKLDNDMKEGVSSETLSLLAMGTFEGNIGFNGENRDEENITVKKNKLVFPQCSIRTIIGSTVGTDSFFVEMKEEDIRMFIQKLEKIEIVPEEDMGSVVSENSFEKNAFLDIVLLNSKGNYQTVGIEAFKDNTIHIWNWEGAEDYQHYRLMPDKDLTNTILKLTKWRYLEKDEFAKIKEVKVENTEKKTSFSLTDEEVNKVIEELKKAERIHEFQAKYDDIHITAVLEDKTKISMKVDPYVNEIAVEGAVYEGSEELKKIFMKVK